MSTSRDVARLAGVSQSTVSYVMSGKRPVAPETEQRVREAMTELGYRPHASARALKSHRSGILGLVAPFDEDTDTAGQYRYVVALAEAARAWGHELLVISGQEGIEGMERLLGSALCEGILAMDVLHDDERVELARGSGMPCVFIGLSDHCDGVVATDTDFEEAGVSGLGLLAGRGHERIVLLNPASARVAAMGFTHRFTSAVLAAADQLGAGVEVVEVAHSYPAMARTLDGLTARGPAPEAFLVAPGVSPDDLINVLHHRGVVVGRDVSVVAARGSGRARHSPVECTGFDADVVAVAATAVRLLVEQLDPQASRPDGPVLVPAVFRPGESLVPASFAS
ncbi:MAG: LacI family DNA-binding transcriptional regulator [Actinomyces sp.]|uniref:LacI family DNA-binding transcriptional regulator n=1 Tax=Actinomyces sp. TaxID=29317 RepID=UPI0026DBCC4E|nr:LacI family DNA-binding transcriptional regulator [Actinomyces sp.]MDO4242914.1 LacI family DNA-binding transcriptional regulator [Actinomyces sp.]